MTKVKWIDDLREALKDETDPVRAVEGLVGGIASEIGQRLQDGPDTLAAMSVELASAGRRLAEATLAGALREPDPDAPPAAPRLAKKREAEG